MGRGKRRRTKFRYNVNRKKMWLKAKKLPKIDWLVFFSLSLIHVMLWRSCHELLSCSSDQLSLFYFLMTSLIKTCSTSCFNSPICEWAPAIAGRVAISPYVPDEVLPQNAFCELLVRRIFYRK